MTQPDRPKVLIVSGYFDWFSGYQEVGLARGLEPLVETSVLASDRVNPTFSNHHLSQIGQQRFYAPGVTKEEGVCVVRVRAVEYRSMVWSSRAIRTVRQSDFDLIIQVMPGQALPVSATFAGKHQRRVVFYGDNVAMYAGLSDRVAHAKAAVFSVTKGAVYRVVNRRAERIYGYTPNTVSRLDRFTAGREMELLPLAFDDKVFAYSPEVRRAWRRSKGYKEDSFVVVAAGKVQPQKRIDELIRSVSGLSDEFSGLRLHIVGIDASSAAASRARDLVRSLGLEAVVTFEEFVSSAELNSAFNGADLGVWPVMPAITIQQAMGTGLPVLLPMNDLVSHLLAAPESGQFYRPQEPLARSLRLAVSEAIRAFSGGTGNRDDVRRRRAEANEWLSSTALARRVLADANL